MTESNYLRMINVFSLFSFFVFTGCNSNNSASNLITNNPVITKTNSTAPKKNTNNVNDSSILFLHKPLQYDTTKKYIYLTFDDGPQNGTVACADVCKKLNMKATFFMVGQHASSPHLKQIVKNIKYSYPLLLLANHSTTHANGKYKYFYNHEYMALNDFLKAQETLSVPYKIIRLPGNTSWVRENELRANKSTKPVCKLLDSIGYNVLGWDVEWNFNHKTANPVQTPENLLSQVNAALATNDLNEKNHLVILTHDRMFRNPGYTDSLAKFITLLQQNKNFVFETMDNYPKLKKLN